MTRPTILVLGHGRHGKDTVAEILRHTYGYNPGASSEFAAGRVMMDHFEAEGRPYASVDDCFSDRHNHRAIWFNEICRYNAIVKHRLAQEMIAEGHDAYVGMRSDIEYRACRHLFDLTLWVDATGRGIPIESSESFTIQFDPESMHRIANDGTIEDLREAVHATINKILGGNA